MAGSAGKGLVSGRLRLVGQHAMGSDQADGLALCAILSALVVLGVWGFDPSAVLGIAGVFGAVWWLYLRPRYVWVVLLPGELRVGSRRFPLADAPQIQLLPGGGGTIVVTTADRSLSLPLAKQQPFTEADDLIRQINEGIASLRDRGTASDVPEALHHVVEGQAPPRPREREAAALRADQPGRGRKGRTS